MKRKTKILLYIILSLVVISGLFLELRLCRTKVIKEQVSYHKESKINYITNLKDNKFYNSSYLQDDYNFVASLIENFSIDYNYLYTLSEDVEYILTYDAYAVLEVYDSDNKDKPIEKNVYEIYPKTTESNKRQLIKVDLFNQIIDYQTYNKIVQDWKREISPDAMLTVYFNVNWTGNTAEQSLSDSQTTELRIPISQKTISITKPNDINVNDSVKRKEKIPAGMKIVIGSTVVLIITVLLRLVLLIIEANGEKDVYETEINKILREFDRAITEAKGKFKKASKDNNIEVSTFMELMDVHDNLNVPIIFYRDSESKVTFVVRDDKNVYYCVMERKVDKKRQIKRKSKK